jgi:hypothetical protein
LTGENRFVNVALYIKKHFDIINILYGMPAGGAVAMNRHAAFVCSASPQTITTIPGRL